MIRDFFKIKENWVVFYDLFSKNYNGDSTRPLAEMLRKKMPEAKFFFVCNKKNKVKTIDMADEVLVNKSLKFYYVCKRAKYIISPMGFPRIKKRKGQVFVQTWHGSPLKELYLSKDKNNRRYKRYAALFKETDIFCSQAEIHNKNLAEAFDIKPSQIFNTGLPRNDILFDDNREFCGKLKKDLGLPNDKKVLFYCPTWRRYDYKAVLPFNLKRLKEELSGEYVILIRSHVGKHSWVDENNNPVNIFDGEFSFDGSLYPEVTHLYLISDALITDYSSSLFDFSILQRPQIFYAYDLENYKKEFGLYFDYKSFVPGDIPTDTESLIQAVKNLPEYYTKYGEKCREFKSKYVTNENGTASEQITELMFSKGKKE